MISHNVFIYFKEYSNIEQSLAYPSEMLVKTVRTSVMMAEVADLNSVQQHIILTPRRAFTLSGINMGINCIRLPLELRKLEGFKRV